MKNLLINQTTSQVEKLTLRDYQITDLKNIETAFEENRSMTPEEYITHLSGGLAAAEKVNLSINDDTMENNANSIAFDIEEYFSSVYSDKRVTVQDKEFIKYQIRQEKNGFVPNAENIYVKNVEILEEHFLGGASSWKTKDGVVRVEKQSRGFGCSRCVLPDWYNIYYNQEIVFKTDSYVTVVNYTVEYVLKKDVPKSPNEKGLIYHQKAREAEINVERMLKEVNN